MSDAERGLLSCLLNYPELFSAEGMPQAKDFANPQLRRYATAAFDLAATGTEATPATIAAHPAVVGEATPLSDLLVLQDLLPSPETWKFYAQRVREEAEKKAMLASLREAARQLKGGGGLQDARRVLSKVLEQPGEGGGRVRTWAQLHDDLSDMAERAYQRGGEEPGVHLPWSRLQTILGGYGEGDLAVVAGIPGGGKTVYALQVAEHAAERGPVLVFSLEMRGVDLVARSVVRRLRVEGLKMSVREIQGGQIACAEDWRTFGSVVGSRRSRSLPLVIDDTPSQTVAEISRRARLEHRKAQEKGQKGLALVEVDYSQLIAYSGQFEKGFQEISEAAKSLKGLARELDCVVLLLAQLDSEGMAIVSKGGTPGLSNIAGSKDIGKHCDSLTYILWDKDETTGSRSRNFGTFYVEKNRQGSTGSVRFYFDGEIMEFREVDNR